MKLLSMLPFMLLLGAAPATAPETAVDAERAFYRAAQSDGQWTAFRKFMTPDATLFVPQPARAADVLPAKNPPIAVQWWPAESYVSCDGKLAVNTGGWKRPDGAFGYFTTVWQRQADGGWKWIVDGGDGLATSREHPKTPVTKRATCPVKPMLLGMPAESRDGTVGNGMSGDGTLFWKWTVGASGERHFEASLWDGQMLRVVIDDPPSNR